MTYQSNLQNILVAYIVCKYLKIPIKVKEGKKIAEIKGNITEVEVFPNNVIEWWFVPVKTGIFDDLKCKIKDKVSKKTHSKMGMVGTIVID